MKFFDRFFKNKQNDLWLSPAVAVMIFAFFAVAVFFDDLFLKQNYLISHVTDDLQSQFYVWRKFGFDELKKGHLALWNPYLFCGTPFLGGFQSALLYPPNWIFLFFPVVFAINFSIVLHVFLAGLFTYLWTSQQRFHPLACVSASLTFMLGGSFFFHVYPGHMSNLCTMVWAPLTFWAIDRILEDPSMRRLLVGMIPVSFQLLAGHVQYFFYTSLFAALYALGRLFLGKPKVKEALYLIGMYAGAMVLTAAQWLEGLRVVGGSLRNIPVLDNVQGSMSMAQSNFISVLMPGIFGLQDKACCWSEWRWWEFSVFCGVVASSFAIYGALKVRHKDRWFILFLGTLALYFARGFNSFLYRFAYYHFPLFHSFRGAFKFNFLFCLFFVYFSAMGLDAYLRQREIKKWPVLVLSLFGGGYFLFGVLDWHRAGSPPVLDVFRALHWAIGTPLPGVDALTSQRDLAQIASIWVCSATFGALGLLWFVSSFKPVWRYGVVILGAVEMTFFAISTRVDFDVSVLNHQHEKMVEFFQDKPSDCRVRLQSTNNVLTTGGHDIYGGDPMILGRYCRFLAACQSKSMELFSEGGPNFEKVSPAYGLIRYEYLIRCEENIWEVKKQPYSPVPRALLLGRGRVATSEDEALKLVTGPRFDFRKEVVLEEEPFPEPVDSALNDDLELKDLTTDKIEVKANLKTPKILLINDNYSSGWQARALPDSDQRSYRVLPGDYISRAIALSAGHHHFLLEYAPLSFTVGKWVSITSLGFYLAFLGFSFWRRSLIPGGK